MAFPSDVNKLLKDRMASEDTGQLHKKIKAILCLLIQSLCALQLPQCKLQRSPRAKGDRKPESSHISLISDPHSGGPLEMCNIKNWAKRPPVKTHIQ